MRPVLYTSPTCPHCATVKAFLKANGLSNAVDMRDVSTPAGLQELRRFWPSGGVPTLVYNGKVLAGDANQVIAALRSMFGLQGIRPAGQAASSSSIPWGPIALIAAVVGFGAYEAFWGEEPSLPRSR